jgi:ABC-type phosphate transport system substrate-binding protein
MKALRNLDVRASTSLQGRLFFCPLPALLGLVAISGALLPSAASATAPEGLACVAHDGKINGRGANPQLHMHEAFAKLYSSDICGSVEETEHGGSGSDPAGHTMIAYNYPEAASHSGIGSGQGQKAASCRSDAFAAADQPYTEETLAQENGEPGATGGCPTFTPPFQPSPSPFPNANDIKAPMMSFPIAGSAVTIAVDLPENSCAENKEPTSLKFTKREVSRILGGDAATWADAELRGSNPEETEHGNFGLSHCSGNIKRVVRSEPAAGTTNTVKLFLIKADNARTGGERTCEVGKEWKPFNEEGPTKSENHGWPGAPGDSSPEKTAGCTEVLRAGSDQEVVKLIGTTANGVGYGDLTNAAGHGLILASLENGAGTNFQPPNVGTSANCNLGVLSLPGSTASDAVGLNAEDNWGSNNEEVNHTGNHVNATDAGSKYPICDLTFDFVYTGLHANNSEGKGAISRLTVDQRRTLYSYFTMILSSTGQSILGTASFAPIPAAWLSKLQSGFQAGF